MKRTRRALVALGLVLATMSVATAVEAKSEQNRPDATTVAATSAASNGGPWTFAGVRW